LTPSKRKRGRKKTGRKVLAAKLAELRAALGVDSARPDAHLAPLRASPARRTSRARLRAAHARRLANPTRFEALSDLYARDLHRAYRISPRTSFPHEVPRDEPDLDHFNYTPIEGSDGPSFEVLSTRPGARYARDRHAGYYYGDRLEGADGPSLVDLNLGLARDSHSLYYLGERVSGPDLASFRRLDGFSHYALDREHVYHCGRTLARLEGADPATFQVLDALHAVDRDHVFHEERALVRADRATFRVVAPDPNGFQEHSEHALDRAHVYFRGRVVTGSDPATFVLLSYDYAKDRHRVYHDGEPIPVADPETFVAVHPERPYRNDFVSARDRDRWYSTSSEGVHSYRISRKKKTSLGE